MSFLKEQLEEEGNRPGTQRTRAPAKRESSPTPWAAFQRVPLAWPLHHSRDHCLPCACCGRVREGVLVRPNLLHASPTPWPYEQLQGTFPCWGRRAGL